jgi:hypothetical protein
LGKSEIGNQGKSHRRAGTPDVSTEENRRMYIIYVHFDYLITFIEGPKNIPKWKTKNARFQNLRGLGKQNAWGNLSEPSKQGSNPTAKATAES